MHNMFLFGGLAYASLLATAGFFVFFAAERTAGLLKTFGRVLGAWLCLVAFVGVLAAAISPWFGVRPGAYGPGMMGGQYPGWMHQWPQQTPAPPSSGAP